MKSDEIKAHANRRSLDTGDWFCIGIGVVLISFAISNVSLWIDEGYSGMLASKPSIGAWAHALNALTGSDSQLPGYYLYLWIWSRLFGFSGLSIRLANLPWIVIFVISIAWASKSLLNVRKVWLIACLSPFIWFYANEARPYLMIIAVSMALLSASLAYVGHPGEPRRLPWFVVGAVLLLWFTHMLAITILPSLLILLVLLLPKPLPLDRLAKDWGRPILTLLPLYLLLAGYYAYTLTSKRGGVLEKPGLGNLAFAMYEFLGFDGLGPPRSLLRTGTLHSFFPYGGTVSLGIVAAAVVIWVAASQWLRSGDRGERSALLLSFGFGLILIFALAYLAHFRVLGRHMAVFFPFFLLLLLTALFPKDGSGSRTVATVALLMVAIAWSVSDARQRLLPKYQKDDYRDAVATARAFQKSGYEVLWLADVATARYYGLETTRALQQSVASDDLVAAGGDCYPEHLRVELQKHSKFLVVFTDRQSYDPTGQCRRILALRAGQHVANFNDFEIWRLGP